MHFIFIIDLFLTLPAVLDGLFFFTEPQSHIIKTPVQWMTHAALPLNLAKRHHAFPVKSAHLITYNAAYAAHKILECS